MSDLDRKIILITRRTRLQELVARYNTVEQARFQAEHLGMDFGDFLDEDATYQTASAQTRQSLEQHGRLQSLDRSHLPNFLFPPGCLVVTLGQDGLVANTLKYLHQQPLLAINPDPARWDGLLLPFGVSDLGTLLPEVMQDRRGVREVTMAKATLSDGAQLLAVNDFFIGTRSHVSARYELALANAHERQSSSGVIVSTGLGSTGWLRSVLTGAAAIAGESRNPALRSLRTDGFAWNAQRLVFNVREPFPSRSTSAALVFGDISPNSPLRIRSLMPEGGVIFSDGVEVDGLEFRSGLEATVTVADQKGHLLH